MSQARARLQLQAATGIHRGDRQYQQDRIEIFPHPRVQGLILVVVADGMGGRSGGRMAADQVMLTAQQLFERFVPSQEEPLDLLHSLVRESHLMIKLSAISAEQEPHSTVACALLQPDGHCHWAHVGDSRVHVFRAGKLVVRTKDHSYVQDLVDAGTLSEGMARNHPMSNVLTSSLGTTEDPPLTSDSLQLQAGDVLLLCTDGLWHYFVDAELGSSLGRLDPRDSCEFLIAKARQRAMGRGDNLSLAVVKLLRAEAPATPPKRPPKLHG
ncbi:MAG: PP2C family protein-serine/threonine phosphatase [Thiomonas sp.]|uniref:Putative Serine/threonine protein phosphatase n=1 Tax=mine drainage metagenome TaxID=410659 RepID=E6PWD0_9ZZZZ